MIPDQVMWPMVLPKARSGAVTRKALTSAPVTPEPVAVSSAPKYVCRM